MFRVSVGSFRTRLIIAAASIPNIKPRITPPTVRLMKSTMMFLIGILLPERISAQILNRIIQVASLRSDSPSIRELSFFGAPTSLRSTAEYRSEEEGTHPCVVFIFVANDEFKTDHDERGADYD
jgi:predicted glycosyltransferase